MLKYGTNNKMLPPEQDTGYVEYKRFIIPKNINKRKSLKTQLCYRLQQGFAMCNKSIAIYYLGIEDDGSISNTNENDLKLSLQNLKSMCNECDANIQDIKYCNIDNKVFIKVYIEQNVYENQKSHSRIVCIGKSGSGKSTFIGVTTYGYLDDGNGSARSTVHRHLHECDNGITSSIKKEIIGFNKKVIQNYKNVQFGSKEQVIKNSDQLVTLIDLPGDVKYIKTTIFGILANEPDHVLFFINLNDIINPNEENTKYITNIKNLLENLNIPYTTIGTHLDELINKENIMESLQHINIKISSKTGDNLENVWDTIQSVKPYKKQVQIRSGNHFRFSDVSNHSDLGLIAAGKMMCGRIHEGSYILIGPMKDDKFISLKIESIHNCGIRTNKLLEGEWGSVLLSPTRREYSDKRLNLVSEEIIHNAVNKINVNIINSNVKLIVGDFIHIYILNIHSTGIINKITEIENNIKLQIEINGSSQFISSGNKVIICKNEMDYGLLYCGVCE